MTWDKHATDELRAAQHVLTTMADADDLTMTLYEHWWVAARPGGTAPGRWDPPLGWALRAAHSGGLDWSPEPCEVLTVGAYGAAVVADPPRRRALGRGDYLTTGAGAGLAPAVGSRLRISRRRGGHDDQGWWRTWGEEWRPARPPDDLTRIYFAPRRIEVARLVHELTRVIPRLTAQWALKVATDPAALDRADAVVLYVPDGCRGNVFDVLYDACVEHVRNASPPFTELLAPGISWSEDPGDGRSFGETRCAWLAEAYWRADAHCSAFSEVAAEVFAEHGVDHRSPHLRSAAPGSAHRVSPAPALPALCEERA